MVMAAANLAVASGFAAILGGAVVAGAVET